MTHGFKYRPEDGKACPHRHIFVPSPNADVVALRQLSATTGFGSGFDDEGLGIAFGWNARAPLSASRRRAVDAGRALADVIRYLRRLNPNRPIHFIEHSMGTELALEALHHIQTGSLSRIISMTGGAYQSRTLSALETPAGRQAEFINVTSRENDMFDFMYEWLIQPPQRGDRSIGLGFDAPNAVPLQIDCSDTLDHHSRMIFPVGAPQRRVCHWYSYTRPGVLRLYNALLRNQDHLSLHQLRGSIPEQSARSWSRLFALPRPHDLLPFAQKASCSSQLEETP